MRQMHENVNATYDFNSNSKSCNNNGISSNKRSPDAALRNNKPFC